MRSRWRAASPRAATQRRRRHHAHRRRAPGDRRRAADLSRAPRRHDHRPGTFLLDNSRLFSGLALIGVRQCMNVAPRPKLASSTCFARRWAACSVMWSISRSSRPRAATRSVCSSTAAARDERVGRRSRAFPAACALGVGDARSAATRSRATSSRMAAFRRWLAQRGPTSSTATARRAGSTRGSRRWRGRRRPGPRLYAARRQLQLPAGQDRQARSTWRPSGC